MKTTQGCSKKVWSGYGQYDCSRAGKIEEGGKWYCATHAPSKVAARAAVRNAEWDRKNNARNRTFRANDLRYEIAAELLKLDSGSIPLAIRNQVDELRELEATK